MVLLSNRENLKIILLIIVISLNVIIKEEIRTISKNLISKMKISNLVWKVPRKLDDILNQKNTFFAPKNK